jgi:ADP-heptose:LPS heptosyltransferase
VSEPALLVLRALGLGDLLTAVPALRGLARAFPEHRRLLAAPAAMAPLLDLVRDERGRPVMHGLLDLAPLAPLPNGLRPAVAVNLHGRGPQSHRLLLAARPARMIAFAHPEVRCSWGLPRWRAGEHEVHRWCRLLGESGVGCDPEALDIRAPSLEEVGLPGRMRDATLIHPGAASGARRWPLERWAAVARAQMRARHTVLVSGGPEEVGLAGAVARNAGLRSDAVLAGKTGLRELAAVVGAAGRVVCGDTGVAHLASALRTPSVLLFGPVPPYEWGPLRDLARHRAIWKGRRGDPHAPDTDPGLLAIGVEEVLSELERLERGQPPLRAWRREVRPIAPAGPPVSAAVARAPR